MKIVIKVGGSLFDQDLSNLYDDIAVLTSEGNQVILVHGGGPQINRILEDKGAEPKYIVSASGMKSRLTDEVTRDAAIMALGGLVNKHIVAALIARGVKAFGFTGVDGAILPAHRKDKIVSMDPVTGKRVVIRNDYSGKIDPDGVKTDLIGIILGAGYTPVIGALAIDDDGAILNTDGDRAAATVCKATGGDFFVSATDVPGVLKDITKQDVIPSIPAENLDTMMEKVEGGMKKKIFAVKEAVSLGIKKVVITSGLVAGGVSRALKGEIGTTIIQ